MLRNETAYYQRNLLISIIISEILVILAFVLSPKEIFTNRKISFDEPVILINEIPQTTQSMNHQALPPAPEVPPVYITDEPDAYETLGDVSLTQGMEEKGDESSNDITGHGSVQYARSAPRLLYEVVPAGGDEDDYHGRLQVSLKINPDGKVIDHRILFNSLDCADCLNNLIKAAYKSKWEPAAVNGKNEDYWVVKSYTFN